MDLWKTSFLHKPVASRFRVNIPGHISTMVTLWGRGKWLRWRRFPSTLAKTMPLESEDHLCLSRDVVQNPTES